MHIRQTDKLGYTPSAVYIFLNTVFKYEDRLREIHTVQQDQILGSALDHRSPKQRFFLPSSHTLHVRVKEMKSFFFLCHKVCLWQKWDQNLVFLSPKLLSLSSVMLSPPMPTTVSKHHFCHGRRWGTMRPLWVLPTATFLPQNPKKNVCHGYSRWASSQKAWVFYKLSGSSLITNPPIIKPHWLVSNTA